MKKDKLVLWKDVVSLKDLIISIFINVISTMGMFFLVEKGNTSMQLFMGLLGAVIGFIITSILFKPKRNIKVGE